MTVRLSTGLRNAMADSTGFAKALKDGVINIYDGTQPLDADSATRGTLLATVTNTGGAWAAGSPTNGLEFDPAANGTVGIKAGQAWKYTGIAAGVAGWGRFVSNVSDAGGASTTLARLDMAVGQTGSDLNISNVVIAVGVPGTIDVFNFAQPAQ